jgi:oligo-alginate lyase
MDQYSRIAEIGGHIGSVGQVVASLGRTSQPREMGYRWWAIVPCLVLTGWAHATPPSRDLPPHPRLLLRGEDVPRIRSEASAIEWKKAHANSLRAEADEWLGRDPDVPAKGGGWMHDYCCPTHGAVLRTASPTQHVCPIGGERLSGPPYDDAAIAYVHQRIANGLRTLGIVYQLTGDRRYAEKARDFLSSYADRYTTYALHKRRPDVPAADAGRVGAQTLDEAAWLIPVLEGADCIWETLDPGQRRRLEERIFRPAVAVIRRNPMGIHNIQCWHDAAVGLAGLLLGDPELVDEAVRGPAGFIRQVEQGTSSAGMWHERAWDYHFYALAALLHLAEAARHCGIDLYSDGLKHMFDAPLRFVMPDGRMPDFGDSYLTPLAARADLYELAFARYNDPLYTDVLYRSGRQSDYALCYGQALPQREALELRSRNDSASGYGILVGGRDYKTTWLCLDYGARGGHTHPDQLGFILYGLRRVIATDPGRVSYGSPLQDGWYRSTIAHNTLTLDEQQQRRVTGRCETFVTSGDFSAISASADGVYVGVSFRRTVALIGDDLVAFIDQVQGDREHTFDLAYHNVGRCVPPPESQGAGPGAGRGYAYLRNIRKVTGADHLQIAFDFDSRRQSRWTMTGDEVNDYFTGDGIGHNAEDRVPIVIARRTGRSAVFYWCVTIGMPAEAVSLAPEPVHSTADPATTGATALRIRTRKADHILVVNPAGHDVQVAGRTIRARIGYFAEIRRDVAPIRVLWLTLLLLVAGGWLGRGLVKRRRRRRSIAGSA